jgi:uncharacterized protein YndB with AHSA1/START domain
MKKLTIKRIFNAPIEKIWNAFTDQNILKNWWSPQGMTSSFLTVELKVGGVFRFCFKGNDGTEMADKEFWGCGEYTKIEKPNKLSYYDSFSDAEGNPVPPSYYGISGKNEIEKLLIELTFIEKEGKTCMQFVGENSYDDSMTEDITKGWNEMFNKLDKLLL